MNNLNSILIEGNMVREPPLTLKPGRSSLIPATTWARKGAVTLPYPPFL